MVPPYIGIAGFTTPEQIRYILDALPNAPSRAFMVGVQVSNETLLSKPQPQSGRRKQRGMDVEKTRKNTGALVQKRVVSETDTPIRVLSEPFF